MGPAETSERSDTQAADPVAAAVKQGLALPPVWRKVDRVVVRATALVLVGIGIAFTVMISLEVVSRYVFDFSIFFINALARLLLVWFFLIGAGMALRQGGHVGFELVLQRLPAGVRRAVWFAGQLIILLFFLQMLWSGLHTIGPALRQTEAALGISMFWAMVSFPVGFSLLIYHLITLMVTHTPRGNAADLGP